MTRRGSTPAAGSAWPDELRLVAACGRATLDAPARERLAGLLAGPIDWDAVTRHAHRHGLAPLVHRHLRAAPPGAVPAAVLDSLAALAAEVARANLRLMLELVRILRTLERERIPVVPLKGPVLAHSAYGDIGLRASSDLDLLVSPRDLWRAVEVFRTIGYDRPPRRRDLDEDRLVRASYDCGLVSATGGPPVELHHRLTAPSLQTDAEVDAVLARATERVVGTLRLRTLSAEDEFIFLCVHGARHMWERCEWLCAVAELARGGAVSDWPALMARARAGGSERMVAIALLLVQSLTGLAPPDAVADAVARDPLAEVLARQAWRRLPRGPRGGFGERFLFRVRVHGWRDRVRYCASLLTTPTRADVALLPLPRRLDALYVVVRLPRLVLTYAGTVMRALVTRA